MTASVVSDCAEPAPPQAACMPHRHCLARPSAHKQLYVRPLHPKALDIAIDLCCVAAAHLWVISLLLQLCHCLHHHVAHAAVGEDGHVSALTHHLRQAHRTTEVAAAAAGVEAVSSSPHVVLFTLVKCLRALMSGWPPAKSSTTERITCGNRTPIQRCIRKGTVRQLRGWRQDCVACAEASHRDLCTSAGSSCSSCSCCLLIAGCWLPQPVPRPVSLTSAFSSDWQ